MNRNFFILLLLAASFIVNEGYASDKNNKTVSAPATSAVSGQVIDKSSSEKLAGVLVQVVDHDQKFYTNTKGEFNLEGMTPGTYKLKVNCISYKDKEVTVKVPKGKSEKVTIFLNPIEP